MTMTPDQKFQNLGYRFDKLPEPAANYVPSVQVGNLVYLSGALPFDARGRIEYRGKVGQDMTTLDAQGAARLAAVHLLRVLTTELGSLDRVVRVVKVTGFVNSAPGYSEQHLAVNGASEVFVEVFGDAGKHARSAVGVAELPLYSAVEIEAIVEVRPA